MSLRSAYFDNFKGGPKVLFWGDASAMERLSGLLRTATSGPELLGLNSFIDSVDAKAIVIRRVPVSAGLHSAGNGYEWALANEDMLEFAEQVDAVAEAKEPCHQYLECGIAGEITVMVARDEYPDHLRP